MNEKSVIVQYCLAGTFFLLKVVFRAEGEEYPSETVRYLVVLQPENAKNKNTKVTERLSYCIVMSIEHFMCLAKGNPSSTANVSFTE